MAAWRLGHGIGVVSVKREGDSLGRVTTFPPAHREALRVTPAGKPNRSHRNLLRAIVAAADKTGLNGAVTVVDGNTVRERQPVGCHDLRHTYIALTLAAGVTLPEASLLARHANTRITAGAYGGVNDDTRAKLAGKVAAVFA